MKALDPGIQKQLDATLLALSKVFVASHVEHDQAWRNFQTLLQQLLLASKYHNAKRVADNVLSTIAAGDCPANAMILAKLVPADSSRCVQDAKMRGLRSFLAQLLGAALFCEHKDLQDYHHPALDAEDHGPLQLVVVRHPPHLVFPSLHEMCALVLQLSHKSYPPSSSMADVADEVRTKLEAHFWKTYNEVCQGQQTGACTRVAKRQMLDKEAVLRARVVKQHSDKITFLTKHVTGLWALHRNATQPPPEVSQRYANALVARQCQMFWVIGTEVCGVMETQLEMLICACKLAHTVSKRCTEAVLKNTATGCIDDAHITAVLALAFVLDATEGHTWGDEALRNTQQGVEEVECDRCRRLPAVALCEVCECNKCAYCFGDHAVFGEGQVSEAVCHSCLVCNEESDADR